MSLLFANLALSTAMVIFTIIVHFAGIAFLLAFVPRRLQSTRGHFSRALRQMGAVLFVVLSLFFLHTIEIWAYAILYLGLGEFSALEPALYFSTSTFTTVGFGDVVASHKWRMIAAIESANGFLLIGWSTAIFVTVTDMVRRMDRELGETFQDPG